MILQCTSTSALIQHRCLCTVGGATAHPGPKCLRNQLQLILHLQPSVVFLHLGENDPRLRSSHPSDISSEVINLVELISQHVPSEGNSISAVNPLQHDLFYNLPSKYIWDAMQ